MIQHLLLTLAALSGLHIAHPEPDTSSALTPTRYEIRMTVDISKKLLDADAQIKLRNRSREPVNSASFLIYRLIRISDARDASGAELPFRQDVVEFLDHPTLQVRQVVVSLRHPLAAGDSTVVRLSYAGSLLGYTETGMSYVRDEIDTAYALIRKDAYAYPDPAPPSHSLYKQAGLPTFDYHVFVKVPEGYTVANGGELIGRTTGDGWTTFEFRNTKPAWRMDFGIARFGLLQRDALRVYYLPEDSAGAARVLRGLQRSLLLFTRWFGPLNGNPAYAVMEVPNGWGSQADVSSIIQQAGAFRDSSRQYELYHEVSHLWNAKQTDVPSSRWEEGLATFLEDLASDSLDSKVTTQKDVDWSISRLRRQIVTDGLLKQVPMRDYGARQMTDHSYTVGSVMFYVLYQMMGHDGFTRLIGGYYQRYSANGGTLKDFQAMAKTISRVPVDALFAEWIDSTRWTDAIATASAEQLAAKYGATPGGH